MADLNDLLNDLQKNAFDPQEDSDEKLPRDPGNYIFCLKTGSYLPKANVEPSLSSFGCLKVIYVGRASKNLRDRDFKCHFGCNAGKSTLRKSIGVLLGYKQTPRDKNPLSKKTKFSEQDEEKLTEWMETNLLMFYAVNPNWAIDEVRLIEYFSPPLNLKDNHTMENKEFRSMLRAFRGNK